MNTISLECNCLLKYWHLLLRTTTIFIMCICLSNSVSANDFVFSVFPAERTSFMFDEKTKKVIPYFSGVGKMYVSIEQKKGEYIGLKYRNIKDHNSILDFVYVDIVITESHDNKKDMCYFKGYENYERRDIEGFIKYSEYGEVIDFQMTEFSNLFPGTPFNKYENLKSKSGKMFKEKYFKYINIEK